MSEVFHLPVGLATPRLLGLYEDDLDAGGTVVGWRVVAWAVELPGGPTVTVPPTAPTNVTMWHSLEDAATALDAYVDEIQPRRPRRRE